MKPRSHLVLLVGATLLAMGARASISAADGCHSCLTDTSTAWCKALPQIVDAGYTPPARGLVETRAPNPAAGNYCVTLYDITQNIPAENAEWSAIVRYHGPGGIWNVANLGTVFGLTLDQYGNIYVCHTSCYATDAVGPGGAGAIYRIDGTTGAITTFATLPNQPDPSLTAPNDLPGLGNISYDCAHDQFFVSDMEDGKIYRLKSTNPLNASPATVIDFFKPLGPDDARPGFAPPDQRVWAVRWHGDRVYYGVWGGVISTSTTGGSLRRPAIRSVALDANGQFIWTSDALEFETSTMPVSDISFGPTGSMLLAERPMDTTTLPAVASHVGHVYEACEVTPGVYQVGAPSPYEAAGGVDVDFATYDGPSPPATAPPGLGGSRGRVWATADAIHAGAPYADVIYGVQGLRPGGGSITTSLLIDSDGDVATAEATFLGDVETSCPNSVTGVGDERPRPLPMAWVTPAPWRGTGALHFVSAQPGRVTAVVLDTRGRVVRRLVEGVWMQSGRHDVALDGLDGRGVPMPPGVYFVRISAAGETLTSRFVILR